MSIKPTERDIQSLINLFENSDWDEFHLKCDGFELFLSKNPDSTGPSSRDLMHKPGQGSTVASSPPTAVKVSREPAPATKPAEKNASPEMKGSPDLVAVKAPNLGTFQRAFKSGAKPFVSIGERVGPDSEVCLLKVMKKLTPIHAGTSGVIREVCAEDGELIEYDQVLFRVEPD